MKQYQLSIIPLLLILLAGCVPFVPVTQPKPTYNMIKPLRVDRYESGSAITITQGKDLRLVSNFSNYSKNLVTFNFLIENTSPNTLLFEPSKVYYQIVQDTVNYQVSSNEKREYAIDPETQIVKKEIERQNRQKQYNVDKGSDAALGLLQASLNLLDRSPYSEEKEAAKAQQEETEIANANYKDKKFKEEMEEYEKQINIWKSALRITTLDPGKSIVGSIYFPYCGAGEKTFQIVVSMDSTSACTIYKQYLVEIK